MKKIILLVSVVMNIFIAVDAQILNDDFALVDGGSFIMGNSSYYRESPIKTVSLTSFYMMKKVVTNAQFVTFLNEYKSSVIVSGENAGKSMFESDAYGILPADSSQWKTNYPDFPAISVNYFGATEFCKWNNGRLPTEAEWEYAAKGGKFKNTYTFSGNNTATYVAWYNVNSGHVNHAVATKLPNVLGLYDMSGNVYQWCSDWYGRYNDLNVSAEGPAEGVSRVIRGGYRSIGEADLHLTHRESLAPETALNFVGFRMVRDSLVSADQIPVENHMLIYPNPFTETLHIQADDVNDICIYDTQGKIVYENTVNPLSIDLHYLNKGMYLMKIKSGKQTTIHKMIKN